jgi:hypothetical protein
MSSESDLMQWGAALEQLSRVNMPDGYRIRQMARSDVEVVTAKLRGWYPDIVVGAESPHLEAEFYYTQCALDGEPLERTLLPLVIDHRAEAVIAVITYERDVLGRSITSRLGVLAPEHRHLALALLGPMLLEQFGRAMGAELAHYFATLKSRHQQVIAERRGFQLVGIMPGNDRVMVEAGEVKRVYEALYAKLLVEPAAIHVPARDALTAQTRALWTSLFGELE